jgi:hypothetical protein
LKKAVKSSLQELFKIVGDKDQGIVPTPMFKLYVELENNDLDFKPKKEDLQEMIKTTMASMHDLLKDFRRIENTMYDEGKKRLDDLRSIREKEIKNNPALARK